MCLNAFALWQQLQGRGPGECRGSAVRAWLAFTPCIFTFYFLYCLPSVHFLVCLFSACVQPCFGGRSPLSIFKMETTMVSGSENWTTYRAMTQGSAYGCVIVSAGQWRGSGLDVSKDDSRLRSHRTV